MTIFHSLFSNNRFIQNIRNSGIRTSIAQYHDNNFKKVEEFTRPKDKHIAIHTPYCINCRFYIPIEHSPIFLNSTCDLFKPLRPCSELRSNPDLCGANGKKFQARLYF